MALVNFFSLFLFVSSLLLCGCSRGLDNRRFRDSLSKPCPFNRECDCVDLDPPEPLAFETADCYQNSTLPTFTPAPKGKYVITGILRLKCDVAKIPAGHFSAFKSIDYLDLSHTGRGIQNWHDDAFDGVSINNFGTSYLNGVLPPSITLQKLGQQGLIGLFVTLDQSIRLEDYAFLNFTRLETLTIRNGYSHAPIRVVGPNAFAGLETTLKALAIVDAPLPQFPVGIKTLRRLRSLTLNDNGLTELNDQAFLALRKLRHLSLDYNDLGAAIEAGALKTVPQKLKELLLKNVDLTTVPSIGPKVRRVDLSENLIKKISTQDFTEAGGLEEIDLSKNPISAIEVGAFGNLKNLSGIRMDDTNLTVLDLSVFSGLPNRTLVSVGKNAVLKKVVVSDIEKVPLGLQIWLVESGLEVIDAQIASLLKQDPPVFLDISLNRYLRCNALTWMAYYHVCPRTQILRSDDAICADRNNERFGAYMEKIFPRNQCGSRKKVRVSRV